MVDPDSSHNYKWEKNGLELSIQEGSLKPGTAPVAVNVSASVSGEYKFPDNTDLVSGVYWITSSQKFSKNVSLKLRHCVSIEHPDELNSLFFLTASSSQEVLPYEFKKVSGGIFSQENFEGSIELPNFSGWAIGCVREILFGRRRYAVRGYHIFQEIGRWMTEIVIVSNTPTHLEVILLKSGFFLFMNIVINFVVLYRKLTNTTNITSLILRK